MRMLVTTILALWAFISIQAHASSILDGKIMNSPSIVLDHEGTTKVLKFASPISQIRIWEGLTTAEILTQEGKSTQKFLCGEPLGFLAQPLILKADMDGKPATIVIPARGAAVFQNGGCSKDGSPQIIQINLTDLTKQITIDLGGTKTTQAVEAVDAIVAENAVVKNFLQAFSVNAQSGQFAEARAAFSKALNMTLLPLETRQLLAVRGSMPAEHQPIDTTRDYFASKDLSKLVGHDINSMTMSQYVNFFTNYFSTFRNEAHKIDDTYAFRILDINASPEDRAVVIKTAVDTYTDGIIAFAKAGGGVNDLQSTAKSILTQGLLDLSFTMPEAEFNSYLAQAKAKVRSAMASDPKVAAVFNKIMFRGGVSLVK